mmetsp:Transcript_10103/g.28912  ORF Transcript_10103/g.28912 Transcript_10103/m.28912 type:complete len:235 (+) Transcript_10103:145-849(+)
MRLSHCTLGSGDGSAPSRWMVSNQAVSKREDTFGTNGGFILCRSFQLTPAKKGSRRISLAVSRRERSQMIPRKRRSATSEVQPYCFVFCSLPSNTSAWFKTLSRIFRMPAEPITLPLLKGTTPTKDSKVMIPNAQMSPSGPISPPKPSGAMYCGVPAMLFSRPRAPAPAALPSSRPAASACASAGCAKCPPLLKPKSSNLRWPEVQITMLSGFTSRCTKPHLCTVSTASRSSAM